ncbi:MAG: phosphoribosylglycinamide formyltransferase, partial [Parvibaculum sp.]|nr:phosphoribosylglycinamide formyltransferase [Parvibaculum sp.]
MKIGVLISGRGSNLKSLIDACAAPGFPAEMVLVISNKADAGGLQFARDAGIPTRVVSHRDYDSREAFDRVMDEALREAGVDFVCSAGFMRILSDEFVEKWRDRQLNIHPSLLPSFKGLNVYARAIEAG